MSSPPSFLTVELEEQDIYKDLSTMLTDMMRLRQKSISQREFDDNERDEYLHLTYRFASALQGVADPSLIDKMDSVAKRMSKDERLLSYDPLQDEFWKEKNPRFVRTLDDVLFSVARDDFHDLDAKHHVLQAIKYLSVSGENVEEQHRVYDTILPFHGAMKNGLTPSFWKRMGASLLGRRHSVSKEDDLTFTIENRQFLLEDVVIEAKRLGFTKVRIPLSMNEFEAFPNPDKKAVEELESDDVREPSRVWRNVIKYTCPLSYFVIGSLPRRFQEKIRERLQYDSLEDNSSAVSIMGETFIGVLALLGSPWLINILPVGTSIVGAYLMTEGVIRWGCADRKVLGSLIPSIALLPYTLQKERELPEVMAEIPVRKKKAYQKVMSPLPYFEGLASLEVNEEVNASVVATEKNYHRFGGALNSYFMKQGGKFTTSKKNTVNNYFMKQGGIKRKDLKAFNALAYHQERTFERYTRYCSLFCFQNERFVISSITEYPREEYLTNVARILGNDKGMEEKTQAITDLTGAKYVHLKRFEGGRLSHDFEGVQ